MNGRTLCGGVEYTFMSPHPLAWPWLGLLPCVSRVPIVDDDGAG